MFEIHEKPITLEEIKDVYPFDSHFFHIKNLKYHYVDTGKKGNSKHTIVMVHGNPTWSFLFRKLIISLEKEYRVIAPDHLGCGLSEKPVDFPYRLGAHIDNFEQFLLSLKLDNIILIMHDWGAAIGMGFATHHPDMVSKLVILNSSAFSMEFIPWRIAICRIKGIDEILIEKLNIFCRAALTMTVTHPLSKHIKRGYLLPYQHPKDRIAILKFVQDIPMSPDDQSYELLLEIEHGLWMFRETPVALIWGMRDWCFTPVFLERWKMYYPQAQVLPLRDAGHFLLEDAFEEVNTFISNFIKGEDTG